MVGDKVGFLQFEIWEAKFIYSTNLSFCYVVVNFDGSLFG